RVEVEAAGRESARGKYFVDRQRQFIDRVRELVGVPTVLIIAAVDVDAAETAERDRARHLVMEAVAGEGRVVCLEIEAVLIRESVTLKEAHDRRGVVVVLVLGRFLWLRLDEERSLETDAVLVLRDHRKEARELRLLAPEVGVEERLVTLAPAPENVVRSLEAIRHLEHRLHLRGGVGEHRGIGVRSGARRVAGVAKEVRGAPEEPRSGARHVLRDRLDTRVEVRARFRVGAALRRDVAIVTREE